MNTVINLKQYKLSFITCFLSMAIAITLNISQVDILIANLFFQNGAFELRDHFIIEIVIHKWGVKLISIILVSYLIKLLYFLYKKRTKKWIESFYIITSSLIVIGIVSFIKSHNTLPCPWDTTYFKGQIPYLHFYEMFNSLFPTGHCFPSGHASGAFSLLSLYYSKKITGITQYRLLLPGIILGIIFGFAQQMRGAHFLSHDLATLSLTIFINLLLNYLFIVFLIRKKNIKV